jgi:hypothetical protein
MVTQRESRDRGIKTKEGHEIYKRSVERSGRIQQERSRYKMGSEEFDRLTKEDLKVLAEGYEKAMALNPKPKRKSAPKSIFNRRR